MPTLLQINVSANWGSTGKIAEAISAAAQRKGWKSYVAYGRYLNQSSSVVIKIGTVLDNYVHFAFDKLFDKEGRGAIAATRRLVRRIEKIKPDVVHLHNIHDHYLNYQLLFDFLNNTDIKVVWTFHDCWAFTGHCYHFVDCGCQKWQTGCHSCPKKNPLYDRSKENYLLKKQLFLSNRNLTVVPVSDWMGNLVRHSFLKGKTIRVIHNGVNLNSFTPSTELGETHNSYRIIAIANVWTKSKGLDDIIKLRSMLPSDFEITVVGLSEKQIESLPQGINGFKRQKSERDLINIYSQADVLINTTYADTYPTVNLEALACGTPVVTYQTGGSPETIDEKTGVVVPQGDVEAMAKALIALRTKPLSRADCRKRAEDHFDDQKCYDKYIDLYDQLLSSTLDNSETGNKPERICTHCVMNSTDSNLTFDQLGVCDRCADYENHILPWWKHGEGHEEELENLISEIKQSGEGKKYDCILGLSGGLDSSYLLHLAASKWGLRPYVLHIDAGWDLPVTTGNLQRMCEKLNVMMHVKKLDWDEMRDMQIAFFKAGFAGLDAPQDHAFVALVDQYACKIGVKYILNGYNVATEVVSDPASWFLGCGPTADSDYIKDVLRCNGNVKVKNYVWTNGLLHKVWMPLIKGVKTVTPLNLIPLTRRQMIDTLREEYGFEDYGQKHFEDEITKFIEGYWNVKRFGYDIRIVWLSSLVMTGEITREEALKELSHPPLSEEEGRKMFKDVARKLEVEEDELQRWMDMPFIPKKYKSNEWMFDIGIKIFSLLGLNNRIRK